MIEAGALLDVAGAVAALGVGGLARALSRAPRWRQIRLIPWVGLSGASYFFFDLHTAIPGVSGSLRSAANGLDLASLAIHIATWVMLRTSLPAEGRVTLDTIDRILVGVLGITALLCAIPGVAFVPGEVLRDSQVGSLHYYDVIPTAAGNAAFVALLVAMGAVLTRYAMDLRRGVHSRYLVAALGLLFIGSVHDILVSTEVLAPPYLAGVFFLAEIVCLRAALMRGFVATANTLDRLTADLEARVEERTAALEKATETLRRTERLATLGQLAGGVAHEINNPIAAVIGNLTVLQESTDAKLTADDLGCLTDSLDAARRVARIVRQLQQAGARTRTEDTRVTVDVCAAVSAAVETARAFGGGNADIQLECTAETFATGERTMLEQVVTNLVQNAVQAIPTTRTDGRVTVRVETDAAAHKVRVIVTDNGTGMTAATKARLFEPFFSTKAAGAGTGLGLAVSATFVTAMKGEMRVDSTEGKGSTFTIELDDAEKPVPASAPASARRTQRRRVLLVDDDAQVLSMHARQLRANYDVETTSTVKDALALAKDHSFDAVVCDLTMPDGGGERLLRDLRAAGSPLADRTLLITGGARTAADDDLVERMGSRVLMKPCARAELVEAIERVLA